MAGTYRCGGSKLSQNHVQPRNKKIRSKMGIGTPNSQSKM
jgi:hypothetical protein